MFDKTGTLTKGSFRVTAIHPEQTTEAELLRIAAAAECYSNHPISNSLIEAYGRTPDVNVENIMELAGAGIRATIENQTVLVGNDRLMKLEKIDIKECAECHLHHRSGNTVHIAIDGIYMGHIVIADEIKEEATFNTMIHELLHTCPNCMNHGKEWKKWADIINKNTVYNIKRTTSSAEKGIEAPVKTPKYTVTCTDCGREWFYNRAGTVIQSIRRCRCPYCRTTHLTYEQNR